MQSIQAKIPINGMTAYFGIFKEPRGFIRFLQFIFAIFAFATACNGSSSVMIRTETNTTNTIKASWSYPYNLKDSFIEITPNGKTKTISDTNDIKTSAEFFVFTGVTSMLISLAFALGYIFLDLQYRNDERFPIADFVVTSIWSVFWIGGSSAWAKGVSNIRSQTRWENIAQRSNLCAPLENCKATDVGTYANITVSVIFGFLNFVLWVGAAWFIFKETKFFRSRTAQQQQQQQQQQQPHFSDIGASNMPAQSQTRPPGALN